MLELKDVVENVVIKRAVLADSLDKYIKENYGYSARDNFVEFRDAFNGTDTIASYDFTVDDLARFTNDPYVLNQMIFSKDAIYNNLSEEKINQLLNYKRNQVLSNYIEYNSYYRMLLGLPPMIGKDGTLVPNSEFFVYLPKDTIIYGVDINKPVHEFNKLERKALASSGELAKLKVEYTERGYDYLKYLDKDISIVNARLADNLDIIYADTYNNPLRRFMDHYREVRNNYMMNYYHEGDAQQYEFYEPLVCVHLIMSAIANTNAYIPRDQLDSQTIDEKYIYDLFESYSLPKFNFSTSYLEKIASRLNSLTMKKGSKDVFNDISKMFDEISVFKYFLYKRLKNKGDGVDHSVSPKDKYELFYVKAPLNADDPYPYIQREENLIPFRSVADNDPKWGYEGNNLEDEIKAMDFTYTESKYIGLNNKVDLITYSYQASHFIRYVIEHKRHFSNLRLYLDTADYNATLFELITMLQILVYRKLEITPDIPDNLQAVLFMYGMKANIDYKRIKLVYKEYFKYHPQHKNDIDDLIEIVEGRRYSLSDAIGAFENNYNIVKRLKELQKFVSDAEDWKMIDYTIRSITYSEKMPEMYNHKTNLEDYLATSSSDSIKLISRINELNTGTKEEVQEKYGQEIGNVINLIRENIDRIKNENLSNILDTTQTLFSDFDLVKYLEDILDFYKSYTQDLYQGDISYSLVNLSEGMRVIEKLKVILKLKDWEQVTFALLYIVNPNEILRIVKDLISIEDTFVCKEALYFVHPVTRDLILIGNN